MKTSEKMLYVGNEAARQEMKAEVEALEQEVERLHDLRDRRLKALDYIIRYGGIDGDHHKAWVLDQVVRALTGCPMVTKTRERRTGDGRNEASVSFYTYEFQGESEEYREWVADAKRDGDDPDAYDWDVGIPP